MKFIIVILLTITVWAKGDFFSLYAENKDLNRSSFITSDYIASIYATYKNNRIEKIENKIIIPRVINFSKYLYKNVVNIENCETKKDLIAYSGVLFLLAGGDDELIIPDGYEELKNSIIEEYKLITEAKKVQKSPITHTIIDYKKFSIKKRYNNSHIGTSYFRALTYAQYIPLKPKSKELLLQIISKSQTLNNLYRYIIHDLTLIGFDINKNENLFPQKAQVFKNIDTFNVGVFLETFKSSKNINRDILELKSFKDYDYKIVKTLIDNNHLTAAYGYFFQRKCHANIEEYNKTKFINTPSKINIEKNLKTILSVMIEDAYLISQNSIDSKVDSKMIDFLKKLRLISKKADLNKKLTYDDINFLYNLDYFFNKIIHTKSSMCKIKLNDKLSINLNKPTVIKIDNTVGGRYSLTKTNLEK